MLETAEKFEEILCCPSCKGALAREGGAALRCRAAGCGKAFPVVGGRPVLIDEDRSVFHQADYRSEPAPAAPASAKEAEGTAGKARLLLNRIPSP